MKALARLLARLFPQEWRARYGIEFDRLLEDADIGWLDVFGVIVEVLRIRIIIRGGNSAMDEAQSSPKILDLASRDIPHGYELESAVEYPREDGSKLLVRNFCREIDLGDSYVTLNHWSRGQAPAQTVLVFGTKGEVSGDFRTDETEMLVLESDGTVRRTEQTVKTWLKYDAIRNALRDKYRREMAAGLSPDEIFRDLRAADGLAESVS
jgi:hypothetical protein